MRSQAALPLPPPDALAASQALASRIAQRIRLRGGWIGLDEYMAMALYEPQLGYYAGGSRKFGGAGDFVTAPELCAQFGACLARQCAQWFESCAHRVVEFGAGSGAGRSGAWRARPAGLHRHRIPDRRTVRRTGATPARASRARAAPGAGAGALAGRLAGRHRWRGAGQRTVRRDAGARLRPDARRERAARTGDGAGRGTGRAGAGAGARR